MYKIQNLIVDEHITVRTKAQYLLSKITNPVLMFHYVRNDKTARAISQEHHLLPLGDVEPLYNTHPVYFKSRVNLTDIPPERGRKEIAIATGLHKNEICYGLELIVDGYNITNAIEGYPHAYQIFTKEAVPAVVLRTWDMDKVEQRMRAGYKIKRKFNGIRIPIAFYELPQKLEKD